MIAPPVVIGLVVAACDSKDAPPHRDDVFPSGQARFDGSTDAPVSSDASAEAGRRPDAASLDAATAETGVVEASTPDAATVDAGATADAAPIADAGLEADAAPVAIAHLYASTATGAIARFDVVAGQLAAGATASIPAASATGLAIGPAGVLFAGDAASGGIERFATPGQTPTAMTPLAAPAAAGWTPSGLVFAPATSGGGGTLWVSSSSESDLVAAYTLDASGDAASGPSLVSTGLAADASAQGNQGLAWDAAGSSLFIAADTIRRFTVSQPGGNWMLAPLTDPNLSPLGAKGPTGLVVSPNDGLIAVYPSTSSFLNLGYWSIGASTTTLLQGAQGVGNSFSPFAVAILPTQPASEPIRVYVGTQQNQVVALDVTSTAIPAVTPGDVVCNVTGIAGMAIGD